MLAISACSDDLIPTAAPEPSSAQITRTNVSLQPEHLLAEKRFAVEITATGEFRPGVPTTVRAHTRATFGSRRATLRIALPDVEIARINSWRPSKAPLNRPLPIPPCASCRWSMVRPQ